MIIDIDYRGLCALHDAATRGLEDMTAYVEDGHARRDGCETEYLETIAETIPALHRLSHVVCVERERLLREGQTP